ncbi:MAG: peptide deformylase [Nitriliruptoraceae bacterium]
MGLLEVRLFGDPVLRQRALEVRDFDGTLARLAEDMAATMHANDGVGLAANQVGVLRRLFTFDVPTTDEREGMAGAVTNPTLVASSEARQDGDEGCLSFPGLFYPVQRPLEVRVRHQGLDGEEREVELHGLLARVWLHEMDHLDGVLFVDHLARHDRREALRVMRERDLDADEVPGLPDVLGAPGR